MRIGLLSNLSAGRNRSQLGRLLDHIQGERGVVHVETSAAGAVPDALAELARQDVELLVVNGGDGTLAHVLGEILAEGAFEGRVPLMAVLRGGRSNMSALDLGTSRDSKRAMSGLIERARSGDIPRDLTPRSVLRVQYEPYAQVRYGMFFGAGVIHRAIELVHRAFPKERQGVFAASALTAALLARTALLGDSQGVLAPDKVALLVDGVRVDRGESTLVMATSLERLFLRMRPFWGSGSGAVRLTAIAADARRFGRSLPGILTGNAGARLDESQGYLSRNADGVHLRMDCGFTVDGELVEPSPDRVVSLSARDRVLFVRA